MATVQVPDGATRCRERYDLERWLCKAGHRFPTGDRARLGQPLSAFDCVVNLLAYFDSHDDARGHECTEENVEFAAGWDGAPGMLWKGLLAVGLVVPDGLGHRWNGYWCSDAKKTAGREKKRRQRARLESRRRSQVAGCAGTSQGTEGGTEGGTGGGTSEGTGAGTTEGTGPVGLGSGSGSGEELPLGGIIGSPPFPGSETQESATPLTRPRGTTSVSTPPKRSAREALLVAEPNAAQQPPRADGRTRTLLTTERYLGLIELRDAELHDRLSCDGVLGLTPGELLLRVSPDEFTRLERRLERHWDRVSSHDAYVRSSLAAAWWELLGRIADAEAGGRADRRELEDDPGRQDTGEGSGE